MHRKIESLCTTERDFLFVKTMNYGTWLRLAALSNDRVQYEHISKQLQRILQTEYDRRFALRTHSYRALMAAKDQNWEVSAHELALANSVADKNPWGLEYCNHIGATAKIYLYRSQAQEALIKALQYLNELAKTSFQSSFIWEANLTALQALAVLSYRYQRQGVRGLEIDPIRKQVLANIAPYRRLAHRWARLIDLVDQLIDTQTAQNSNAAELLIQQIRTISPRHANECSAFLSQAQVTDPFADSFSELVASRTQALRFNRDMIEYINSLRSRDLKTIDAVTIAEASRPIFDSIFDKGVTIHAKASLPGEKLTNLGPGISESPAPENSKIFIELRLDETQGMSIILALTEYGQPLSFRRDRLVATQIWKEATEGLLREKLMHSAEVEREISRAITQTTQMLAHDLRRPFSLMEMMLMLTQKGLNAQTASKFQTEIRSALAAVNGMLADIMQIGAPAQARTENAMASLTQGVRSALMQSAQSLRHSPIALKYQFQHRKHIQINQDKLIRVISNIVSNAAQSMNQGGEIRFSSQETEHSIELVIHNTNSYIPDEIRAHIFEKFYSHGKSGGTGLGLAIVAKLVSEAGGQVSCDSDPETGTSFRIKLRTTSSLDDSETSLPNSSQEILVENLNPATGDPQSSEVRTLANSLGSRLRNLPSFQVLVCDDEELYAQGIQTMLERNLPNHAIDFIYVSTAEHALARSADKSTQILIFDVDLPGSKMNGLELTKLARRAAPNATICVHSNRGTVDFQSKSLSLGADLFLPKPMHEVHLLKLIEIALNRFTEKDQKHA